jgi:hypothetical protein
MHVRGAASSNAPPNSIACESIVASYVSSRLLLLLLVIQGIASMKKEENVYQIFIITAVAVFLPLAAHDK